MYYLCSNHWTTQIIESPKPPIMRNEGGPWTSRSPGYISIDILIRDNKILDKECVICGRMVQSHFYEPTKEQIVYKNMCFECNFWDEKQKTLGDSVMIVDGHMYRIGDENSTSYFRGFGGNKFTFNKSGKIIVSTNVWSNGDIPFFYRKVLPNNAIIINN